MTFAGLVSQLEEPKFLRLFRHLVEIPPNDGGMYISDPAQVVGLPNTELHRKTWNRVASIGGGPVDSWYFQLAHCPSALWQRDSFRVFVEGSLRSAFEDLAASRIQLTDHVTHSDYYFFTNRDDEMFSEWSDEFTSIAHRLFTSILGVELKRHPRFGYSTPESLALHAREQVDAFLVDLINQPSSYYLVARGGRVSIVPVTEHGSFFSSRAGTASGSAGAACVITSTTDGDASSAMLSQFEELLNDPRTREQDLQSFLAANPQLLFGIDERYCEIRPHVCVFDSAGERLVPDFMARIHDSSIWDVIELKLPTHKLVVDRKAKSQASAAAARGIAELLRYRDVFGWRSNRKKVAAKLGTSPYEPALVLVIGRGRHHRPYEWRTTLAGFPSVRVVSYDYLFEHARACRSKLSAAINKRRASSGGEDGS